jgi:hypothetical protein
VVLGRASALGSAMKLELYSLLELQFSRDLVSDLE